MAESSPLQRGLARARDTEGYRRLRAAALTGLRAPRAGRVLSRLQHHAGTALVPTARGQAWPPAGRLVAGSGTVDLPVALVCLLGLDDDQADPVLEDLARLQLLTAAFRPVVVLDRAGLGGPRRYGWTAELVVPEQQWVAAEPYAGYLARRLAALRRSYGAEACVTAGPRGLDPVARAYLTGLADRDR